MHGIGDIMTKKQVKKHVRELKKEIEGIMKANQFIVYAGVDDNFQDMVCHLIGDLEDVLNTMDEIIRA